MGGTGAWAERERGRNHANAPEMRVKICMTRKEVLFDAQTIERIKEFYFYHNDPGKFSHFERIISEPYYPKIKHHPRGFSDLLPAYESTISDLEDGLGRSSWAVLRDNTISIIHSDFRKYVLTERLVITYDNDSCFVKGYKESDNHFHVLLAKSKKTTFATFKKFRKILREMQKDYDLITAHVAELPCVFTGLGDEWRFEKDQSGESRLLKYWKLLGFKCYNKNAVRIINTKAVS